MNHDPIDAFFDATRSTLFRTIMGLGTILISLAICIFVARLYPHDNPSRTAPYVPFWHEYPFLLTVMILYIWHKLGGIFFLGLICYLGQIIALFAFTKTSSHAKFWWFMILTFSLTCYSPVSSQGPWWSIVVAYSIFTYCYWLLPHQITKKLTKNKA